MKNYIQLELPVTSQDQIDWLVAELAAAGYEGFEEQDHVLKAYIPEQYWNEEVLLEIAHRVGTTYKHEMIPETNWNAVWESNFEPVTVEKFAGIRAEFHPAFEGIKHEIVITPKMSFGTGHHATTWQMILQMQDINFKEKAVLDFGTGTGVLAILAEKLGAARH
jgi:ribosomal protein L11 methyltransferase